MQTQQPKQTQTQSQWLQVAAKLSEELKEQPPEVQQAIKQISKRQYPQ